MARPGRPSSEDEFLHALYQGGELLAAGKVIEAKDFLERAYQLNPKNEKGQNLLGLTYFKLGMFERAAEIYEALVLENPADPTLRVNLGLVYLKTNAVARAIREFETATDLAPDHKRAHNYLGIALAQAGEYGRARDHFVLAGSDQMAEKMTRAIAGEGSSPPGVPRRVEAAAPAAAQVEAGEGSEAESEPAGPASSMPATVNGSGHSFVHRGVSAAAPEADGSGELVADAVEEPPPGAPVVNGELQSEDWGAHFGGEARSEPGAEAEAGAGAGQQEIALSSEEIADGGASSAQSSAVAVGSSDDQFEVAFSEPGAEAPAGEEPPPSIEARAVEESPAGESAPAVEEVSIEESPPAAGESPEAESAYVPEPDVVPPEALEAEAALAPEFVGEIVADAVVEGAEAAAELEGAQTAAAVEVVLGADAPMAPEGGETAAVVETVLGADAPMAPEGGETAVLVEAVLGADAPMAPEGGETAVLVEAVMGAGAPVEVEPAEPEAAPPNFAEAKPPGSSAERPRRPLGTSGAEGEWQVRSAAETVKVLPADLPIAALAPKVAMFGGRRSGPFLVEPDAVAVVVQGEILTRVVGLVAQSGQLELEPQNRRYRGRTSDKPFGEGEAQLMRVTGKGRLVVQVPRRALVSVDLDDESAYFLEDAVFAFEEPVAFENGRVPSEVAPDLDLVHLRGKGKVLLSLPGALRSLEVTEQEPVTVPLSNMVGWHGNLSPKVIALARDRGGKPTRAGIELSGEGFALLSVGGG